MSNIFLNDSNNENVKSYLGKQSYSQPKYDTKSMTFREKRDFLKEIDKND